MDNMSPRVVTQSHLGERTRVYKPGDNMNGYIAIAKVLKVHHKNSTADVQIINTGDILMGGSDTEGRYGVTISTANAHYDVDTRTSWGTIEPISKGDLVLVGFIDNMKTKPVILGSVHNINSFMNNVLPTVYPLDKTRDSVSIRETLKYLKVFPSQFYSRIDGEGGVEISLPSKSFLCVTGDPTSPIDDAHDGMDHHFLSERDPMTAEIISAKSENAKYPVNILFNHRTSWDDASTTWTKIFLSKTGTLRITRDNNDNKLSYMEMDELGGICISRQLDSPIRGQSSQVSKIGITASGNPYMTHHTGGSIAFEDNGDITIRSIGVVNVIQGGGE